MKNGKTAGAHIGILIAQSVLKKSVWMIQTMRMRMSEWDLLTNSRLKPTASSISEE